MDKQKERKRLESSWLYPIDNSKMKIMVNSAFVVCNNKYIKDRWYKQTFF
jgi:hypothetical protein